MMNTGCAQRVILWDPDDGIAMGLMDGARWFGSQLERVGLAPPRCLAGEENTTSPVRRDVSARKSHMHRYSIPMNEQGWLCRTSGFPIKCVKSRMRMGSFSFPKPKQVLPKSVKRALALLSSVPWPKHRFILRRTSGEVRHHLCMIAKAA
jgi:hypothetical protein